MIQLPRWNTNRRLRGALGMLAVAALVASACGGGSNSSTDDGVRVSPASPTPTATNSGTATVTPTPVPLPERPDNPFDGGPAVAEYLHGGDADLEGCLPDLVREWQLAPIAGQRCFLIDLDGDGRDEYVFIVTVASSNSVQLPGDVWFFEDEELNRALYQSGRGLANAPIENVSVVGMQDVTGDNRPEVVILWEVCGASTCSSRVIVASHHLGPLQNIAPTDLEIASLESFEIDGTARQLLLRGGVIGSVGAGPQRSMTTQLTWTGSNFRVAEVPNEPTYLVHLVNDGDEALAGGQYDEARSIFEAVVENTELADWKLEIGQEGGNDELRAYALFRAGLAAQRSGSPSDARAYISRAATEYNQTLHASAAAAYLNALDRGESPNQACRSMENFLAQPPLANLVREYWDYGYANPERSIQTLCR